MTIRKSVFSCAALLVLAWVGISPLAAGSLKSIHETHPFAGGEVEVGFGVGELEFVIATTADAVGVDLEIRCDRGVSVARQRRCQQRYRDVAVEWRQRGDVLGLAIVGIPKRGHVEVEGTIRIPKSADLTVDMGIGELTIEAPEGDVLVDMGIGEVSVFGTENGTGSVYLDAGIGEAELKFEDQSIEGRRSILVGSELDWSGEQGGRRIEVDLGIGEASVSLH